MDKNKFMDNLMLWQKVLKILAISSMIFFGVIFVILFIWEAKAQGTAPVDLVWTLIIATLFPYLFGGAYFLNEFIIKVYTKKKNKT